MAVLTIERTAIENGILGRMYPSEINLLRQIDVSDSKDTFTAHFKPVAHPLIRRLLESRIDSGIVNFAMLIEQALYGYIDYYENNVCESCGRIKREMGQEVFDRRMKEYIDAFKHFSYFNFVQVSPSFNFMISQWDLIIKLIDFKKFLDDFASDLGTLRFIAHNENYHVLIQGSMDFDYKTVRELNRQRA